MINLCHRCVHKNSEFMCGNCNGRIDLVDNFQEVEVRPLSEVVEETNDRRGYNFGKALGKRAYLGSMIKREK